MSGPILLPVIALPGLLDEGLVLSDGGIVVCTHVNGGDGSEPDDLVDVWDGACDPQEVAQLSVDLRAGRARDAVLRAMHLLLHPGVSDELMSAPAWLRDEDAPSRGWTLATFCDDGSFDTTTYFAARLDGSGGIAVPELGPLEDIPPAPDDQGEALDFLALLACARAVGGL